MRGTEEISGFFVTTDGRDDVDRATIARNVKFSNATLPFLIRMKQYLKYTISNKRKIIVFIIKGKSNLVETGEGLDWEKSLSMSASFCF